MAWTEGARIGAYILGRQLGQGGMATVYLGRHAQLDRDVAIKVMHKNFLDDEGFVARFHREAQIVARLSHPHIVPVYDFDEHEGQPYLVMKYIPGWTLKRQFIKEPLDLDDTLRVMKAIGSAVTYAHEQDILHRDIKPSNIVIASDSTPYLTDFGLAKLASSGESTMSADMLLGTPHYISPEQARGVKDLDGRTDVYSLGVVLYELLVGKVPFTGDSAFSIIHDHIYTPLPPPSRINPEIPEEVEDVLFKALEKHPDERYATASALIDDLEQALQYSQLTELDPNRVSVASASLAKIRKEYEDYPTITPQGGVGSPLPAATVDLADAALAPRKLPFYEQERFYPITGCASLLVIVFVSLAVLLGMSGNLQELAALTVNSEFESPDMRPLLVLAANGFVDEYRELGVRIETQDGVPYIDVPYREIDTLPQGDEPILALLRARSLYTDATLAEARQAILSHAPDDNTEGTVLYYLSAARLAYEAEDTGAAIVFAIMATEFASEDDFLFRAVRPVTLAFIYENAGDVRAVNLGETIRSIAGNDIVTQDTADSFVASPITEFASARNLLLNGNTTLARAALLRVPDADTISSELELLRAELQIQLGNADNAIRLLNGILDESDTPQWVVTRTQELLDELE